MRGRWSAIGAGQRRIPKGWTGRTPLRVLESDARDSCGGLRSLVRGLATGRVRSPSTRPGRDRQEGGQAHLLGAMPIRGFVGALQALRFVRAIGQRPNPGLDLAARQVLDSYCCAPKGVRHPIVDSDWARGAQARSTGFSLGQRYDGEALRGLSTMTLGRCRSYIGIEGAVIWQPKARCNSAALIPGCRVALRCDEQ